MKDLDQQIHNLKEQLEICPPGTLSINKNQNRFKWYYSKDSSRSYLPKSQRPLAEALARKKYLSFRLQELMQKREATALFLSHLSSQSIESDQLLSTYPYQNLLESYFQLQDETSRIWSSTPFPQNPNFREHLIHKSLSNNLVRSKSEAMIDSALFRYKIPFRYECQLQLGDTVLYPDFTIMHPSSQKIFYWEHFGLMDNPDYIRNTFSKLQVYGSNNIIPSINLITTYETLAAPLGADVIEKIITHYFL